MVITTAPAQCSPCLIGFAKSKGFEVLFKMFAGLVGFGLLVGLGLLPVVLSLLPTAPCRGQGQGNVVLKGPWRRRQNSQQPPS